MCRASRWAVPAAWAAPIAILAAALLATGCDSGRDALGDAFNLASVRNIQELSARDGRGWMERHAAQLVRGPLELDDSRTVPEAALVVTTDASESLRLAAALVRAGVARVAVVRGGLAAWRAEGRTASSTGVKPQGG